ncbi:hypothetical protein NBH00_05130 [Paraconexibacter antarcticus]|uniref:Uncharacterized protein n=1 Tax=Paraconexibacter antarcticus TaxID=2949664 RepID=A0ABY5DWC5_9ACTN|nr:hypothetical protein [Paraconexibacter antarcticus]UTI65593.1 hypothetical protein NBH00_05130 [Paraconexibacter antarcticus]
MAPLDIEERVRVVEQKQERLMAQMDEVRHQITVLGTLPVQFAELANSVLNLKDDISSIGKQLQERAEAEQARVRDDKQDRVRLRIALYSLTGVILAALIAAAATVLVAKMGAGG